MEPGAANQQTTESILKERRPLRLVLLGGPGVGKGTQAELLIGRLEVTHFSTGDMFRAILKGDDAQLTPAMREARDSIQRGELASDATTIALVRERLEAVSAGTGVLFDGFPRTVPQAEALDAMLGESGAAIDAVLNYDLPRTLLIQRLSGRRTCSKCGASYHVINRPPKVEDVCDLCGSDLIQRSDDKPEAIVVRLRTYEEKTQPLIAFYEGAGKLITIDADGAPETVAARSLELLAERLAGRLSN